jgi:hypothetical protein
MEVWPSISVTSFALTPSLRRSVAHAWRRSWKRRSSRTLAHHDALEGAVTQVGGVEGAANFVGKVEILILPESGQAHPLFELMLAVILEGAHRWPDEAHAPVLTGLGTRADEPPVPVPSTSERAPPTSRAGLAGSRSTSSRRSARSRIQAMVIRF